MTTLIEKDPAAPGILAIIAIYVLLIAGGLGLANMSGAFQQKTAVVGTSKMVQNRAAQLSTGMHTNTSADTSESEQLAKTPTR